MFRTVCRLLACSLLGCGLLAGCLADADVSEQTAESEASLSSKTIQIENGVFAYSDTTTDNLGGACGSTGTGVDRGLVGASATNCYVGWVKAGEWLSYNADLTPVAGKQVGIVFRYAAAKAGKRLRVKVDGEDVTGPVTLPASGGVAKYALTERQGRYIPTEGMHRVRIEFETNDGLRLDWIRFQEHTADGGYYTSGPWHGYAWTAGVIAGTNISPSDYSDHVSGAYCATGSVAPDAAWGGTAMVGFNVNQSPMGGSLGTVTPTGTGLYVNVTNTGGSALRVQLQGPNGDTVASERWCATLSGAGGLIPWQSFRTNCWMDGGTVYDGQPIQSASVLVPGDKTYAVPFNFCVNSIGPS